MANEYGVTATGFRVKSREQIVSDMENAARSFFGENVNLSAKSPLGLFIQLLSWPISLVWQGLEGVYNSAYMDTATGQSLDNVGKYIGIGRRQATKAVHSVIFTGTAGTAIPLGLIVDTGGKNPVEFEVIDDDQVIDGLPVQVRCLHAGAIGNVPNETIQKIKNPAPGLDGVTESSLIMEGLDRETDKEFRERYKKSVAKGGASTLDSIVAAILEVPNLLQAVVIENDTMETVDGRPPKSIEAIVLGGADADIGKAIFATKAAGIQPYGRTTTVSITDKSGRIHDVSFTRAEEISIYVSIQVTKNANYPSDGDSRLKDQVIAYIGGIDSKGLYNRGRLMGEPVIYMQIPMAIDMPGIDDLDIRIGTSPAPNGTTNISLSEHQKAVTGCDKVEVVP